MLPASFRGLVLGALVAPLVLGLACSDLKHADDANDGGTSDDGSTPVGPDGEALDSGIADADPDVGQPPNDFECGTDAWTKATKTNANCAERRVFVVEDSPIDPGSVSIARSPAGRVGIGYGFHTDSPETGELHLAHFIPSTPAFTPTIATVASLGIGDMKGARVRVAATGPDVLHVLSHDTTDNVTGDVVVRRLTGGAAPLSQSDVVVTGVQYPTELAFAIDSAGTSYATALVKTPSDAGTTGKIVAYRELSGGPFQALPNLATGLLLNIVPGAGETSLFVSPSNQVNALFPYTVAVSTSWLRHETLDNALWSPPKSIDSVAPAGVNGYSAAITTYGARKVATYVTRKNGQAAPATAEVKIARWQQSVDTPTSETIDTGLYATDATLPFCRLAAAVDKYGLEHVVFVSPDTATTGTLVYMRQTRATNGDLKWLRDTIDPDVLDGSSQPFVDLVVDENARPHIAYISAKDGRVRYATRFDR